MIVISKDVIARVYNELIKRPFNEVADVAIPLWNEIGPQFKALEEKIGLAEAPATPEAAPADAPASDVTQPPAA